jgi:hypothetical protein
MDICRYACERVAIRPGGGIHENVSDGIVEILVEANRIDLRRFGVRS